MGTSQSHKLLKTPAWSQAKRAMTEVAHNPSNTNIGKFMHNFSQAIQSSSGRGGSSKSSFGHHGSLLISRFLDLVGDARNGVFPFISESDEEKTTLTPQETLILIYDSLTGDSDSNPDQVAAQAALDSMLNELFDKCETVEDIKDTLKNLSNEDIIFLTIEYQSTYILEYAGELFQEHIFSKEADPASINADIKNYIKSELSSYITENGKLLSPMSTQWKQFIETMTSEILEIWK